MAVYFVGCQQFAGKKKEKLRRCPTLQVRLELVSICAAGQCRCSNDIEYSYGIYIPLLKL